MPLFVRGVGDQCDPPLPYPTTVSPPYVHSLRGPRRAYLKVHSPPSHEVREDQTPLSHCNATKTTPNRMGVQTSSHLHASNLQLTTAITLQQILEYGLSFQLPQESTATPFLSNFHTCLTLETNNPPLTHFQTTHQHTRTYTKYQKLLQTLKRDLKTNKLTIVSADKGPGLILLGTDTLTDIYDLYFTKTGHKVQTDQYKNTLRKSHYDNEYQIWN